MFISDREGNRVAQKCVAVNPVLARTQFLYSNANDSDDYVFVEPGNYYIFTPTIGGFKLGLADVTIDNNVLWVARPGKSIFICVPANEEYLHYDGLIPGSRGYLRKLTGKEDETSTNMWNQLFPNLVAYYRMDDNADNTVVVDSMGYSDGVSIQNTNLLSVEGKIDRALEFDGTNDYIDTNDTFQSIFRDSFTVSLWVETNDGQPSAARHLFSLINLDTSNAVIVATNSLGELLVQYMVDGYQVYTTVNCFVDGLNNWKMLTAVFKKLSATTGQIDLYVDGSLVKEGIMGGVNFGDYTNLYHSYLGAENENGVAIKFFSGLLDDVMIFNRVLTPEEITFLYERGGK